MKRIIASLVLIAGIFSATFTQEIILQENFGTSAWSGNPSDYPDYTSTAEFSGDDSHSFNAANSSGYPEASGGVAVLMGNWTTEKNVEFVMKCNTSTHNNIRLSFGITHNSDGWGTCQLTNNFTKIEYSTDNAAWTEMDKASLVAGSYWPCAEENTWSFVELLEELPSSPELYIRFTHTDPTIHPYLLDDITLTGYLPDQSPPETPSGLQVIRQGFNDAVLVWNSSTDDSGIKFYEVHKNGVAMLVTSDTIAEIKYQQPGSAFEFSVVAVDVSENRSESSSPIQISFNDKPVDYKYSWQESHANILPGGDIMWQPRAFEYVQGNSVYYIDYEGGDDADDGLTKMTAWKHHPWDDNATANAAACSGIHTYVFKKGVVYRGTLDADDFGTPVEPVRLTVDPTWGSGDAMVLGSVRIEGGWTLADETSAPNIPEPDKVWYVDIALPETKMVCELSGGEFSQLHVARSPNYQWTEDDLLKTWWTMTGKSEISGGLWLRDNNNLIQDDPAFYAGATIFSQEDAIVMCTVWKQEIEEWDPDNNRIRVQDQNFGGVGSHYFIENTPFLLDTVNEFYYDQSAQRLFVRLEGEKNPNTTVIEAAVETQLITIDNAHDIEISGLTFGITTDHSIRYGQNDTKSVVRMTGICNNISIHNNEFLFVNGGISLNSNGSAAVNTTNITVSDNDFQHVGDHAIVFSTSDAYIDGVNILRNNIYDNGYRHQGRWYSSIPAIYGQLNYGEVAGNVIDFSMGNGIDMFWGKGGGSSAYVPFIRGLIYQNKASNTLIGTNDYGGIESWQGGPAYCFNNYAHNAMGYKHYNNQSIGYAYYFDGSFKHYVFNNVASGVSHNRNSAAIMQVLGYYNMYVHNTAYNTDKFLNAWKGSLALNGHNAYISNLAVDVGTFFRHEISPDYIPYDSYGYNVSSGSDFNASLENLNNNLSLSEFSDKLEDYQSQMTQTGWNAENDVVAAPAVKDFSLLDNSEAIGRGVKFFTAFPLAKVVGEWNFYKHPADLSVVMGDNFYMTEDFNDRDTYKDVPKNHLSAVEVSDSSFITGALEDWTEGALTFDGSSVYCSASHGEFSIVKSNNLDMTDNDFIVEIYFRAEKDHVGGVIVSKYDGSAGYMLVINDGGNAEIVLSGDGTTYSLATNAQVNDSAWHHLLVEVKRNFGVDMFLDGALSNGQATGDYLTADASLSNTSDFLVGKDAADNFFNGAMDFLRISKGSLYDARTTLDELYEWQTNGPFLYDMRGNAPEGQRDAGAIEALSNCALSVAESDLSFSAEGGAEEIKVVSSGDILLRDLDDTFFSTVLKTDTIVITVPQNTIPEMRKSYFTVVSCNETSKIKITQEAAPCEFTCDTDTIKVNHEIQSVGIDLSSNGNLELVTDPEGFVSGSIAQDNTSLTLNIEASLQKDSRISDIVIEHCDGTHTITVVQEGVPCTFAVDIDSLKATYEASIVNLEITTGEPFDIELIPNDFISGYVTTGNDTIILSIAENEATQERSALLIITHCEGLDTVAILQEANPVAVPEQVGETIFVYPNPVREGRIFIEVPSSAVKQQYRIINTVGTVVSNGMILEEKQQIEFEVPEGLYLLEIITNEKRYRSQFMVF